MTGPTYRDPDDDQADGDQAGKPDLSAFGPGEIVVFHEGRCSILDDLPCDCNSDVWVLASDGTGKRRWRPAH